MWQAQLTGLIHSILTTATVVALRNGAIREHKKLRKDRAFTNSNYFTPFSPLCISHNLPPSPLFIFFSHRIVNLYLERKWTSKDHQSRSLWHTILQRATVILPFFQNLTALSSGERVDFPTLWVWAGLSDSLDKENEAEVIPSDLA